jgi:hypothetical protein
VTGGGDDTARLWDVATGWPIGPPLIHQHWVSAASFSPDGRRILTGSRDGTARLWERPIPLEGEAEHIRLWAEVLTGKELDDVGMVKKLDAETWRHRRQQLAELSGLPIVTEQNRTIFNLADVQTVDRANAKRVRLNPSFLSPVPKPTGR